MNILNNILETANDKVAFISKNEKVSYADIKNIFNKNKKNIENLKEFCVVINARDNLEFAKLISILDGNVKRVLFLPKDINPNLHDEYYKKANVNFEVFLENDVLKQVLINNENSSLKDIVQTQWIIPTSGTTKSPKLVAHTFKSLTKTTKTNNQKSLNSIWGLTFDIYRFSGIQVFLQSILSGSTLIIPETDSSIKEIIELFAKNSCNIISATASFWRKVLMTKESKSLNIKRATLGGEIIDQNIILALKNKFKDIKITHIYASTEVGVGFAVNDELAGFPYSYIKNGVNNLELKIDDNSLLFIKPKAKEQEYLETASMYDKNDFINTGDIVRVENNRVYFLGRVSGSINVGGNKVLPEEVENTLLSSNLVSSAFVYAKSSSIVGSLVCADVVALNNKINKAELKKQILDYCKKHLEKFKIPTILKIVDDLQINQNGKLKRN